MKLTITNAVNGWIIESTDGEGNPETYLIEECEPTDSVGNSIGGMQKLLWTVMDKFGHYGSKHGPQRLRVVIVDQTAELPDNVDPEGHWYKEWER